LFDHIELDFDVSTAISVKEISVELNHEPIFHQGYVGGSDFTGRRSTTLSDIFDFRLKRLGYTPPWSRFLSPAVPFDGSELESNPVVRKAAGDLGQAWNPKYGGKWETVGGEWDGSPRFWCSEFASWALRERIGIPKQRTCVRMLRWFLADGTYFGPLSGTMIAPPNATPEEIAEARWRLVEKNYRELGDRVLTGCYCSTKSRGHSVIFLYWIGPNGSKKRASTFAGLLEDIETTEPEKETIPASFDPAYDLNWFASVGGCQGGKVSMRYHAVLRLCPARANWAPYLTGAKTDDRQNVLIWTVRQGKLFGEADVTDGFGLSYLLSEED
jgi:hypothetical protein